MTLRRRSGSLLIISLSLVAILSVLAVAIARQLSFDVRLTKLRLARGQAKALARSGVYLAMRRIARDAAEPDGKRYDWLGDDWAVGPQTGPDADPALWVVPFPAGRFSGELRVRIADEERRLALNLAGAEPLTRLTGDAAIAQMILDARDEPDPAEDRPGDTPPYAAKNGPFAAPEELAGLPGMTPELYEALRASASPYLSAPGTMNINTVSVDVLRAAGLGEGAVDLVARFREREGIFTEAGLAILETLKDREGVDLTGTDDGNLLISDQFGVTSELFTVVSEGVIERPALRARVEAVIRRAGCGGDGGAPCILAWQEL